MTQPETPADCRRCRHDERTRGVIHLSTFQLYPPDHADDCPVGLRDRIAGLFRSPPGGERLGDATPGEIADAVLAVLSASAGRAAALTEAAARLEALDPVEAALAGQHAWRDAAALLRRLAAEAHDGDTQDDRPSEPGTCGHRSSDGYPCTEPSGHLGYHRNTRQDGNEWTSWVGDQPAIDEAERCSAEPPTGWPGDCWCTLPSGHDGDHRCEPCSNRHDAPGWTDAPAVLPVGSAEPQDETGTRAVCVCSHTRAEHITVSGRLLCDACDPDSTSNLVCRGFDAL
jgi:hypothetical protein